MSAPRFDVLLAEAKQLRAVANALAQKLADAASVLEGSAHNHMAYAHSHALAIDSLGERVAIGVQCALDCANYRMSGLPSAEWRSNPLGNPETSKAHKLAAVAADPRS